MTTNSDEFTRSAHSSDRSIDILWITAEHTEDQCSTLSEQFETATVTTAATGTAGLEQMDSSVDCVLCEPPLPDQQADKVFERVREIKPAVPTILCSDQLDTVGEQPVAHEHVTAVVPSKSTTDGVALSALVEGLVQQYRTSQESPTRQSLCKETLSRIPETALVTDRDGVFQWIDPAAESLFELSLEEIESCGTIEELFGEEPIDRDELTADSARSVETTISVANREPRTARITASLDAPRDDIVLYTIRETTQQTSQRAELRETKQALETILSNVPVIMFTLDETGVFTRSRGSALSRLGLEAGEVVGQSAFDIYSDHPEICKHIDCVLAGESVHTTVEVGPAVFESWYEPLRDDDGETVGVVGLSIDITDQERRQRELETHKMALNTAADMVYELDSDGTLVMINDAVVEEIGYDRSALVGQNISEILTEESYERGQEIIEQLVRDGSRDVATQEFELETAGDERIPVESRITALYAEDGEFRGTIGVARNISERKKYEEMLSDLHDISLGLLTRRESDAVIDQALSALNTVLDIEAAGIFQFNEYENVLEPAAVLTGSEELTGTPPTIEPGEGVAWDVFVSGTGRVYDDLREAENLYDPDLPIRSAIFLPLGDHGLLVCGSTESGAFGEDTVDLVDLLAATTETVLDRIEGDRQLQESDHELHGRIDELTQQIGLEERFRRITTQIVDADTREQIHETVCRELSMLEDVAFVWSAETSADRSALEVQAQAGTGGGYLDAVSLAIDGDAREAETLPAVRAIEQNRLISVDRIADSLRDGDWQPEALSRDLQSVLTVPIASGTFTHGAVSVYADSTAVFDDHLVDAFTDLGETIAHALSSIERRQSLAGGTEVEVEFRLDGTAMPALALADRLDAPCIIKDAVPGSPTLLYGAFHGTDQDAFHTASASSAAIDSATVLAESGTELAVRLALTEPTAAEIVADCGASFRDFTIAEGVGRLRVTFPSQVQIGEAIRRITSRLPSAELHSRRQRTHDEQVKNGHETLTDRQHEVLLTAYHGGYYEWPREQSAGELAAVLDISKSTFLEHLRRAERKLLGGGVPEVFDA